MVSHTLLSYSFAMHTRRVIAVVCRTGDALQAHLVRAGLIERDAASEREGTVAADEQIRCGERARLRGQ